MDDDPRTGSTNELGSGFRLSLCLILFMAATGHAAPRAVASIVPIHSLVAGIMEDVAEPTLIVRGFQSPHTYQMRPSNAVSINEADIVFWVGRTLETFLDRSIHALPRETRIVELSTLEGLLLLPNRKGGVWEHDAHRNDGDELDLHADIHVGESEFQESRFDPHIWLDIGNAKRIVRAIATELIAIDPDRTETYLGNEEKLLNRLGRLDDRLERMLAPLRDKPYAVLHDGYHYLERRYGLNAVGAVMVSPDRMPSAKRIRALQSKLRDLGALCVFGEPQFESALLRTVVANTNVRSGIIDPIGSELNPGKDAYFEMMAMNADSFVACLTQ